MSFAENTASSARWTTEPFLDELRAWVESSVGPVVKLEQSKLRVWAGVWRATTADGVFHAKQNCEGQALEAALTADLAVLAPDHVVPVAAVDRARGLLLTPDQGAVFADSVAANPLSGLLAPLDEVAYFLGEPPPDDARLRRVADAALEVWSDVAPIEDLREALPAALRLGRLGRAESWRRVTETLAPEDQPEYAGRAQQWFDMLPDEVPVRF